MIERPPPHPRRYPRRGLFVNGQRVSVDFFEVRQLAPSPGTASFESSFSSRRQLIDNVLVVRAPYDRYELPAPLRAD